MITKNLYNVQKYFGSEISDKKPCCYGEVGYHGTHGPPNYCLGLNHMEMEGLTDREIGQECLWPVYDSHLGKTFTVKHFCVMGCMPNTTL